MRKRTQIPTFGWIMIGFILHAIGGIFFNSSKPLCYAFCGLGLILIAVNGFMRPSPKKPFRGVMQFMFIIYLLWTLFILVRPFISSEPFTADGYSMINRYTFLAYLVPLLVFLGFKHLTMENVFRYSYVYGILGIILFILNYRSIFTPNQNFESDAYQVYIGIVDIPLQFLAATSFMLLCYTFVSKKYKLVAWITMLIAIITVLFTARRGSVFMYLLIFIFTFYQYIIGSKRGSRVFKVLIVACVALLGFAIFNLYADSAFSFFLSRLDEDTRSGVEDYYFKSFDGKDLDWAIGRGLNGTYYCPVFENPNRQIIETGYLHMILKGGIVYLALFLIFLGQSAYLGFFKSRNLLTKAMAFYLLAHIVFLIPFGLPSFSFEFVLVWVCVLYCQSKKWRSYTDAEIRAFLDVRRFQKIQA